MTSVNAFTPVYANSSLIEYAGEWNRTTWPYRPLSTDSRASLSFTGNGIAIMGSGDLGSNSATGGVNLYVDQGSSHPGNYSTFGSAGNDSTSALGRIRVPAGSHTASFEVNGEEGLNLLFGGFEISDGMTNIQTDGTIYAGGNITDIQYFNGDRDLSVSPDGKDGRDVTYVTGPDSGFAMNFTGLGVAVYTAFNASESTTYSVYFNQSAPPSQGDNVTPFDTYTLNQGTGGLLFHAGALPGGQHRLLIVNTGSGRLGFQSANSLFPDFPLYNSTVCYVNCTQEERDKLTGTDFAAVSGSHRVLGSAVGLVLALSFGLSLGQVVL